MESIFLDLKIVKHDLIVEFTKCTERGLTQSAKWLAELNFSLNEVTICSSTTASIQKSQSSLEDDFDQYLIAKSYFDLEEYDRCAHYIKSSKSSRTRFLYYFAKYLSGEKKRSFDGDNSVLFENQNANIELAQELRELGSDQLDGFGLYLYGVVLKKVGLLTDALKILQKAVFAEPMHWGGWLELSTLINYKFELDQLMLPEHWMKYFFKAQVYFKLHLNDFSLKIYHALQKKGFKESNYISAQIAMNYESKRENHSAVKIFIEIQSRDPYRLDNIDTFSHLLYVEEMRTELAALAHTAFQVDKYRVETCCVVGNYYSFRYEHEKAILYFKRALMLNPRYLPAWTLMGHEYVEMRNTNAAIQSYRHALEVDQKDYNAWYGLGQTYEILRMTFYCLYYYKQAQRLRPWDSRMLEALGDTYATLNEVTNAVKCYKKARIIGCSSSVLLKLAGLYDLLCDDKKAAAVYVEYVAVNGGPKASSSQLCIAYTYLANYQLQKNNFDVAYEYALKCLQYDETKEDGKLLLHKIALKRGEDKREHGVEFFIKCILNDIIDSVTERDEDSSVGSTDSADMNGSYVG